MTTTNSQSRSNSARRSATLNLTGAILLILLGIVFQLSEFGYGHIRPENFWLVSMFVTSIWNLIAVRVGAPGVQELTHFWPLLLICLGVASVLTRNSNGGLSASAVARTGATHEE
ncbi:MAG TPA: hypothetical protein VMJ93_04170 [Verrucomicrobiae bacterium]|nr:hypothetical protein [Verrucomicrobiae bacterium]